MAIRYRWMPREWVELYVEQGEDPSVLWRMHELHARENYHDGLYDLGGES